MRLPAWIVSMALGASLACGAEEEPAAGMPAVPDSGTAAQPLEQQAETPQAQVQAPVEQPMPQITASMPMVDEPWTPEFIGTVSPGMGRDEVVAAWGEPVTERMAGALTFMYFRNGCEVSCGTFDVVFLEDGQVVDAVVRFAGHTYSGVSSSPADRVPEFTPPVPSEGNTGSS